MDAEVFKKLTRRKPDSHKYDYGHVLVIGGSPGMVGAPLLAAKAALRTGAGLVTIAAAARVTDKLERRIEEIMTLSLPARSPRTAAVLETFMQERKVSVVVIGPGLSANDETGTLVKWLLETTGLPLVIDGGALSSLQHRVERLDGAKSSTVILTPHGGEFQRLSDKPLPENRPELKPLAMQFAKAHHVTLALKGEPTYVAGPDGSIYENTTGNPGLATAGTGDVLSGVIAGIVAQGIPTPEAAVAGVYLHGFIGDLAAADKTEPGIIASDLIEYIPAALKQITG